MKKILGVSLVALMAVSTARADIASTAYVDSKTGTLGSLETTEKGNLVGAINELVGSLGDGGSVATQIASAIGDLDATVSQSAGADGLALSVTEADGVVTAVSGSIAANTYDAYGAAQAVADKMVTVTSGEGYNKTSTTTYPSMATAAQIASEAASALAGNYATAAQGAKADSAVQSVVAGDANGQIKVDGTNINVTGLGTAAYEAATAFDAAGTAAGLVGDTSGWATAYGTGVDTVAEAIAAVDTKAGNALTSSSALNGANITAGTVPETALDSTTQGKIDGAVQEVSSGTSTSGNGTIIVDGSPVSVYGLNSAAYTASTAYLPAVASSTTGTDGEYVLTMKVVDGAQTLKWETITRNNP